MTAPEVLEVRCAGCGETLEVEQGMTEFSCPGCATPQALPPELMPPRPRRALPLHDSRRGTGNQMTCGGCGAVLAVPWGLRRIACPLCDSDLAVDGGRLRPCYGGLQVISPPGAASRAPLPLRRPEEDPMSQAIHVRQVQVGRYNNPIHLEQTRGSFTVCSAHRDPTNSLRANTKTAVYVECADDAPVDQLFHGEESQIKLPNGTVPRHDFKKKVTLSASPVSICAERIVLEHPSKVSNAPLSHCAPSNYSVHTEEVHEQRQSNTVGAHARHASVSSIVEQETVKHPSHTACAEEVHVESHGNTTEWNKKRTRSSWSTSGKRKKKHRGSSEELHLKCNKHSSAQPEDIGNINTVQEPLPSPDEDQFNPSDIDRIIANLHPTSLSQKQAPRVGPYELDDIDATLPPLSIDHRISLANRVPQRCTQYSAGATGALVNRSFSQEHEMPQETSNGTCSRGINGAKVQHIQDGSHPLQEEVGCHHNKAVGQHKSAAKGAMHLPNERNSIENQSYSGTHQQVTVVTACCDPTSPPLLTATLLPSTTSPFVSRSSVHRSPPYCQPSETIHSQDAHAAGTEYNKSKKRGGRGPTKLIAPRREADRPVLTPINVDTWDIDPPCSKVASTITLLLKQWHPGSTYIRASQQTTEVHPGQSVLHFHEYHSDRRAIIMEEFLQRYKWAPGREAECLKLFNRRTVRQFTGLLCDEKRRARVELFASTKIKEALDAPKSNGQSNLNDKGARKKVKPPRRDPSAVGHEDDDPLQWKPFPPVWMLPKWWEMLCERWASEEILQVSAQKRKNRFTGGSAQHTAGSRSITMHRKLMMIENGGKPVSEVELFNKTHKHDGGKGEFVTDKARRTMEAFQRRLEEAGDTGLDPHLVWSQEIGGRNRGRYYGLPGIIDKARIGPLSKSIPGSSGQETTQMFTQDQVQEMINHATQQLNETWENRFRTLEESIRGMASSNIPQHAPCSSAAGPGADDDEASHEHTSDSAEEGKYQSAKDDSGVHIGD